MLGQYVFIESDPWLTMLGQYEPLDQYKWMDIIWCQWIRWHLMSTDPDSFLYILFIFFIRIEPTSNV